MKSLRIGFIGNFIPSHSTENDRRWSFEKLGHEVITFQENETTINQLHEASRSLDVIFYSHTHDPSYVILSLKSFFKACKINDLPTVSVHLDRWCGLERVKDVGKEATWFTEYIFMADGSPEAVELYEKYNLNWYWLKPGVVERDCYIAQPDRSKYPHEIIFVGSRGYHSEYPFRPQLTDWLKNIYGDRFCHYGGDGIRPTIRGHDLNVLYASAKIAVGDSCFGNRPRYWSDRVPETMGRGGFLLHPLCDGMGKMVCASYAKENLISLGNGINYWLTDNDGREKNRLLSHNWVKNNETYTQRSQEMLDIIFKND